MSMYYAIPRMEVLSLRYITNNDMDTYPVVDPDDPTDIGKCRILIGDCFRIREIHNPVKVVKDLFFDLPKEMQQQHSDDGGGAPPKSLKKKRRRLDSIPLTTDQREEESEDSEESDGGDSISGSTDLPLTGPDGDIRPYDAFDIIVHQDTDNDQLLQEAMTNYRNGLCAKRGTVKSAVSPYGAFEYGKPFQCYFGRAFGSLILDCIVFKNSRLVTLSLTWLMEKIPATTEAYFRGNISFYGDAYQRRSILLETPTDKVIKLEHSQSIGLLRSVIAVPYMPSTFKVEACLLDLNDNIVVNNSASFVHPKENILHQLTGFISGNNGAKIKVEVSVKPNDYWVKDF